MNVDAETRMDEMADIASQAEAEEGSGNGELGWRAIFKACLLAVFVVVCLLVVYATPLRRHLEDSQWRESLKQMGPWRPFVFVLIGGAFVGIGFPRLALSFAAGAVFGFLQGVVWGVLASIVGSVGCFWIARRLGRDWVYHMWGHRLDGLEALLNRRGFAVTILVRLCPVGNNLVTNCLAGVSPIRASTFLTASVLGFVPMSVNFALMGSGIAKAHHYQTAVSLALVIGTAIGFAIYYSRSPFAREVIQAIRATETPEEGAEDAQDSP